VIGHQRELNDNFEIKIIRISACRIFRDGASTLIVKTITSYNSNYMYKSSSGDEIRERDVTYIIFSVYILTSTHKL